mgnify:CR=1 FL=1
MTHNITVDKVTCSGCVITVDQNSQLVHVEGNVEKSALTEKLFELGYPERG